MRGVGLGELELAIMDHVWSQDASVTVPEVHAHLAASRGIAYTTVMTVMGRLHEKGLLARSEDRRPYTYWPAISREEYTAQLMLGVLDELGDRKAALARFVERIGPGDARYLAELLRKARGR